MMVNFLTKLQAAKILRKNATPTEMILWQILRNHQVMGTKFRRQHPIEKFIVDFYCAKRNLVIELDGPIHDLKANHDYDLVRDARLKELGYKVLRFRNDAVENNLKQVIEKIKESLL